MLRVIGVFFLCLFLAACSGERTRTSSSPAPTPASTPATSPVTPAAPATPPSPPSSSSSNSTEPAGEMAGQPAPPPLPEPQTYRIHLSWEPPTSRENGAPLYTHEIGSYLIVGFMEGEGSDLHNPEIRERVTDSQATEYTLEVDAPGTYYLAMAAVDQNGLESELSNEVRVVVQ